MIRFNRVRVNRMQRGKTPVDSVGVKDVARLAAVSVGTVSNALNHPDRVSEATLQRVNTAIEQLGYVRNAAASQLRAGMSRSVGLVVLDASNPFFNDLARGAEDFAAARGVSVLVGNAREDQGRESGYLDLFEEQRVRGVLITPVADISLRLERLRSRGIPTVLVDRHTDNVRFSSVSVDDVAGGKLAANHLLGEGRRRLAFVGGPSQIRQVRDRLQGMREALRDHGAPPPEVIEVPSMTTEYGRKVGSSLEAMPEQERPDGVFAANDLLALGLLQGLMLAGTVRVPQDMALIGYDDIDFAASAVVPLSSIRQDASAMGQAAMELLLEEADAGSGYVHRQLISSPELVVRASSQLSGR